MADMSIASAVLITADEAVTALNLSPTTRGSLLVVDLPAIPFGAAVVLELAGMVSDTVVANTVEQQTLRVDYASANRGGRSYASPAKHLDMPIDDLLVKLNAASGNRGNGARALDLMNVAIGEVATYELEIQVPKGVTMSLDVGIVVDKVGASIIAARVVRSPGITTTPFNPIVFNTSAASGRFEIVRRQSGAGLLRIQADVVSGTSSSLQDGDVYNVESFAVHENSDRQHAHRVSATLASPRLTISTSFQGKTVDAGDIITVIHDIAHLERSSTDATPVSIHAQFDSKYLEYVPSLSSLALDTGASVLSLLASSANFAIDLPLGQSAVLTQMFRVRQAVHPSLVEQLTVSASYRSSANAYGRTYRFFDQAHRWNVPTANLALAPSLLSAAVGSVIRTNMTIALPEGDLNDASLLVTPPSGIMLLSGIPAVASSGAATLTVGGLTDAEGGPVVLSELTPTYALDVNRLRNPFDQLENNDYLRVQLTLVITDNTSIPLGSTSALDVTLNSTELDTAVSTSVQIAVSQPDLKFVFEIFDEPDSDLKVYQVTIVHSLASTSNAYNLSLGLEFEGDIQYEQIENRRRETTTLDTLESGTNTTLQRKVRVLEASPDQFLCIRPVLSYSSLPSTERDDASARTYTTTPASESEGCYVQPQPSTAFAETTAFFGLIGGFCILFLLILLIVLARRRGSKQEDAEAKPATFRSIDPVDLDEPHIDPYLHIGEEDEPEPEPTYVVQVKEPLISLGGGLYAALKDVIRRNTRGYFSLDDDLRDQFNLDGIYVDSKIVLPDGTYAAVHDWFNKEGDDLIPKSREHIYEEIVDRNGNGNTYDLAVETIYEEIKNVLQEPGVTCPVVKLDDGRKVNLHRAFRRGEDGFKEVFIGLDENDYCMAHVIRPDGAYASIDEVFKRNGDELEPIYEDISDVLHNDGKFHPVRVSDETFFDDENMYELGTALGIVVLDNSSDDAVYELGQDVGAEDAVYDMSEHPPEDDPVYDMGGHTADVEQDPVYDMGGSTAIAPKELDDEPVYSLGNFDGRESIDVDAEDAIYDMAEGTGHAGVALDDDDEPTYELGNADSAGGRVPPKITEEEEEEEEDVYGMANQYDDEDVYGMATAPGEAYTEGHDENYDEDDDCIYDAGLNGEQEPPSAGEDSDSESPTGTIQHRGLDHITVLRRASGDTDVYSLPRRRAARPSNNGSSLVAVSETVQYHDLDDNLDDDIYSSANFDVATYKAAKRRAPPVDTIGKEEDDYAETPSWRRGSMQPAPTTTNPLPPPLPPPNNKARMNLPPSEPKAQNYEDTLEDRTAVL
eukprot:TRINITY_DN5954_c0_g3_i1.p1 TRINITY_DN5954_c0_g3~~TRINITY_DN5954_c0_g3_i1.p1  ORF type:complete len:1345 (+),score=281.52 TRINITY_DN5954_c0_g3_i1:123-4037(+)